MLKIRLQRFGRKKVPTYRIVVANATSPRDGKFLEILGNYLPLNDDSKEKFKINIERTLHWLRIGAKPTDRVKLFITKTENSELEVFSKKFKDEIEKNKEASKIAKLKKDNSLNKDQK